MLLIASMVAVPLLTVSLPVNQPQMFVQAISEQVEPLAISVKQDGSIFIQDTKIEPESLLPKLQAIAGKYPDTAVYIRSDEGVNYGRVMEVMAVTRSAGFSNVSLIANPRETGRKQ